MKTIQFNPIRPDDLHGRRAIANPERGFRNEIYFSNIPGEIAGTCSVHTKQNKLDGRSLKPVFQNIDIPGVPHLIRGNRLDAIEFSHAQWQDEIDFFAYDGMTIMQSYCFLMKYADGRQIPQEKLDDIEQFFLKLRETKVKALLRFAYELSPSISGPTANITLKHIGQLKPLIHKYADVIYVLQAGFVGKFGEFHNSYHKLHADVSFRKDLMAAVLDAIPPTRTTMMRYPALKMSIFGTTPLDETEAYSNLPQARIGHFNDGFLAGPSHGGTFGRHDSFISKEEEFQYLMDEGRFLPMDGELFWRDLSGMALPHDSARLLAKFHYDTFGIVHANQLFEGEPNYSIDVWKSVPVDPIFLRDNNLPYQEEYFLDAQGKFVWRSYYEYIRDHLGYRFVLESMDFTESATVNSPLEVTINLKNLGFSAPVNPRSPYLVLKHKRQPTTLKFKFDVDIRYWAGFGAKHVLKNSFALPKDMPAGEYDLGLAFPDPAPELIDIPEYAIRCANNIRFSDGVNWLGSFTLEK